MARNHKWWRVRSYRCNSMQSNLWWNHQAVLSWLEPGIARSEALLSVFLEGKCWGGNRMWGNFWEEMRQMRIWKNGFILIEFDWYLLIYVEGILPDNVLRWREKGTDLRHKARGKPCGNPHLEHWMQHESTHVTESWRVWSQGSVMLFCRIQYFLPRSKEDWYQSEARQACETEDDLACSELNIFYQYAIEIHRMYIVLYYI